MGFFTWIVLKSFSFSMTDFSLESFITFGWFHCVIIRKPFTTTNTFQKSNWEDPKYIDALLAE